MASICVIDKIYIEVRSFQSCMKTRMMGNTEGDDDQNFRGDQYPYIFTDSRITVHNRGPAHSCRGNLRRKLISSSLG